MKIAIRHPNGTEHSFEGTEEELAKAAEMIPGFVDGFRVDLPPPRRERRDPGETTDKSGKADADPLQPEALDPAHLHARLSEVNANTDIERVTVLAQAAVDAGMDGLDYETVADLYRKLGLRIPAKWRSTFSNAAHRGFIYNVGRGKWRPTPQGENLARYGHKPTTRRINRKRALAIATGEDEEP